MVAKQTDAELWVPESKDVHRLHEAAQSCRGCELWAEATQAVFADGPQHAPLMLVGEQPGDHEDREGEPFVGPAGKVLHHALQTAEIDESEVYFTNAVKHFRHSMRGKRRIHEKPAVRHINACRPWLEAEIAAVQPSVVVCLGATAGRSVLGRPVRVGAERGTVLELDERAVPGTEVAVLTVHPSAVLRIRDQHDRESALDSLASDLTVAARLNGSARKA